MIDTYPVYQIQLKPYIWKFWKISFSAQVPEKVSIGHSESYYHYVLSWFCSLHTWTGVLF